MKLKEGMVLLYIGKNIKTSGHTLLKIIEIKDNWGTVECIYSDIPGTEWKLGDIEVIAIEYLLNFSPILVNMTDFEKACHGITD